MLSMYTRIKRTIVVLMQIYPDQIITRDAVISALNNEFFQSTTID